MGIRAAEVPSPAGQCSRAGLVDPDLVGPGLVGPGLVGGARP